MGKIMIGLVAGLCLGLLYRWAFPYVEHPRDPAGVLCRNGARVHWVDPGKVYSCPSNVTFVQ